MIVYMVNTNGNIIRNWKLAVGVSFCKKYITTLLFLSLYTHDSSYRCFLVQLDNKQQHINTFVIHRGMAMHHHQYERQPASIPQVMRIYQNAIVLGIYDVVTVSKKALFPSILYMGPHKSWYTVDRVLSPRRKFHLEFDLEKRT